jgi:hypothetical protein
LKIGLKESRSMPSENFATFLSLLVLSKNKNKIKDQKDPDLFSSINAVIPSNYVFLVI